MDHMHISGIEASSVNLSQKVKCYAQRIGRIKQQGTKVLTDPDKMRNLKADFQT